MLIKKMPRKSNVEDDFWSQTYAWAKFSVFRFTLSVFRPFSAFRFPFYVLRDLKFYFRTSLGTMLVKKYNKLRLENQKNVLEIVK